MLTAKEKIYLAFFENKTKFIYYNQLKEITNLSHSSLQNIILKMKNNKELEEKKTKGNTFYKLNEKEKVLEFTKITLKKIEDLNLDVKIPLKEFIKLSPKEIYTMILFGSTVYKKEKKGSDIDILVVLQKFEDNTLQELYEKEIRKRFEKIKNEINSRSIYPINLFITNEEEFLKKKDFVIKEAIIKGFPIKNQTNYYENGNHEILQE